MLKNMSCKKFKIKLVERIEVRDFIEKWHYSQSINGLKASYCFGLYDGEELIGAMIYGRPAMNNQASKYNKDNPDGVMELRRLCCIDDTPKNTESYFIGRTLKWLRKNTDVETIISYADMTQGHEGIIYKATNFNHVGISPPGKVIIHNGRQYHDKTIRTKYKGKLKPFAQRIKDALDSGEAYYTKTKGKHIYVYEL
jgi:hypothetical protein